ncbi:MAG: tetratricopeptide repeat protein [Verrucomicrobiota bacterium]
MNRSVLLLALVGFSVVCAAVDPAYAQRGQKSTSLWDDPVFQKELIGSLGINPGVEPAMNEAYEEYHRKIIPLLETEPEKAAGFIREILTDPEASARFDFLLGYLEVKAGNKVEAAKNFKNAIGKFPDYMSAHQNLGVIFVQEQLFDPAIKHLTEAIKLGLNNGQFFGLLGTAYFETKDFIAAESAFRSAVTLDPRENAWKKGLIGALAGQGNYDAVIAMTGTMLAKDPKQKELRLQQASAFAEKKDWLNAAKNLEVLDAIKLLDEDFLPMLGDLYVNANLLGLAADVHVRAYSRNPGQNLDGPIRAADYLLRREGLGEAQQLLDGIKASAPEDLTSDNKKRILRLEAKIADQQGDDEAAASIYELLIDDDPLDGESRISLATYLDKQADLAETEAASTDFRNRAIAMLDEAIEVEAVGAKARVAKAQILVRKGRDHYSEAIRLLKESLRLEESDAVEDFLKQLEDIQKSRG